MTTTAATIEEKLREKINSRIVEGKITDKNVDLNVDKTGNKEKSDVLTTNQRKLVANKQSIDEVKQQRADDIDRNSRKHTEERPDNLQMETEYHRLAINYLHEMSMIELRSLMEKIDLVSDSIYEVKNMQNILDLCGNTLHNYDLRFFCAVRVNIREVLYSKMSSNLKKVFTILDETMTKMSHIENSILADYVYKKGFIIRTNVPKTG